MLTVTVVVAVSTSVELLSSTGGSNVAARDDRADNTALVLAELLDAALADDWESPEPVVAVLCQASDAEDDLRLAVKRVERAIEEELEPFGDDPGCLAVAHSVLRSPNRVTVAVDQRGHAGVVRHPDGRLEHVGDLDLPLVSRLRSLLPAVNHAA